MFLYSPTTSLCRLLNRVGLCSIHKLSSSSEPNRTESPFLTVVLDRRMGDFYQTNCLRFFLQTAAGCFHGRVSHLVGKLLKHFRISNFFFSKPWTWCVLASIVLQRISTESGVRSEFLNAQRPNKIKTRNIQGFVVTSHREIPRRSSGSTVTLTSCHFWNIVIFPVYR